MLDYQAAQSVIKYLDFLHSENGQIQQKVLSKAVLNALPKQGNVKVLDAGCGPGWMSKILLDAGYKVEACDSSDLLIKFAQTHNKDINFCVANIEQSLPYPKESFDVVLMNMVGPDIKNLELAFKNLSPLLKEDGHLLLTIPNPEFTYPAAEWHRSWLDVLLFKKPKLFKKTPPQDGAEINREFGNKKFIKSYYHSLNAYLKAAENANFKLTQNLELKPEQVSNKFNLNYQMQKYPLILLLEFKK